MPALARAEVPPNDPDFPLQWGLQNTGQQVNGAKGVAGADIAMLEAWMLHAGTRPVTVAIVGRGIDPHAEFGARLLNGRSVVGDLFDTRDKCTHDTHLAGIIAAARNNAVGVAGIHDGVAILPVRVFEDCGADDSAARAAAAEGIRWAADQGAEIILVPIQFSSGSTALAEGVTYAAAQGALLIAPSGSQSETSVAFPARYNACIAVAATTNQDEISLVSNSGAEVELAAPGKDIWSTWKGGDFAYLPGERDTASASAFVAGVAALLRSYNPHLTADQIRSVLADSADDLGDVGRDSNFGYGRINAHRALQDAPPPALRFEPMDPFPASVIPGSETTFTVRIAGVDQQIFPGSARLFYRVGNDPFASSVLTPLGNEEYLVTLPAVECESQVEYYLEAVGDGGAIVREPTDAPDSVYRAEALVRRTVFFDDFETDQGWETDYVDPATKGKWERVAPFGTSTMINSVTHAAQPGFDRSPGPGRKCFVTGQHTPGQFSGFNDVDLGPVILTSPVIELNTADAEISYARWFFSHTPDSEGNDDELLVELSRDDGKIWTIIEVVTESASEWRRHTFRLRDFPEADGDRVRIRFTTSDLDNDSLTEAAVDDFRVESVSCVFRPGDANGDGKINLEDYEQMFHCWSGPGAGSGIPPTCQALDFDTNGGVDLADFSHFHNLFDPG